MKIARTIAEVREAVARRPAGLVPTMGFLHEGHLSLIDAARAHGADFIIVSIFVNPRQFGPSEDFERYPRDEGRDRALLEQRGVDLLFMPDVDMMYPRGAVTSVTLGGVANPLEGERRPGHFDGVATIVLKLFNIVQPDLAVFGRKDAQQCTVIDRMVRDLDVPVRLVFADTVREHDGLAMSSRNAYLDSDQRKIAGALNAILKNAISQARGSGDLRAAEASAIEALWAAGFTHVDYVAIRDAETLDHIATLERPARILAAAKIGKTRLIDNMPI